MSDLAKFDTRELSAELARREKAELEAFEKLAAKMTSDALKEIARQEECEFERLYEYSPPEDHCKGCVAEAVLRARDAEKDRIKRGRPGELPSTHNSCASYGVSELKVGDVLERTLYPGADDFDYVQVVSIAFSKDGGKFWRVEFQLTNAPQDETFAVEYPRDAFIRNVYRDWRKDD